MLLMLHNNNRKNRKKAMLPMLCLVTFTCIVIMMMYSPVFQTGNSSIHTKITSTNDQPWTKDKKPMTEEESKILTAPLEEPLGKLLIENAVPKTGSTTLFAKMEELSVHNGFRAIHLNDRPGNNSRQWSVSFQEEFVKDVKDAADRPLFLQRHFHFVNFKERGDFDRNPAYINFLRDPIDRFQSRYNAGRQTDEKIDYYFHHLFLHGEPMAVFNKTVSQWSSTTINACILNPNDRECNPKPGDFVDHPIAYFCGQHNFCVQFKSTDALEEAKYNLERFYTVVGLVEQMELSMSILESKLPQFFANFAHVDTDAQNVGRRKDDLSDDAKEILGSTLSLEYDLYEFAKRRLFLQARELNLL